MLDTTHKRKSFAITLVIMLMLLLIMWFAGMTYYTPPPENGIAVVLGNDAFGMGKEIRYTPQQKAVADKIPAEPEEEPVATPKVSAQEQGEETTERLVSQDLEESVVLTPQKEKKPKPKREEKALMQEKSAQKQTPSAQTQSALASIFSADAKTDVSSVGKGNATLSGNGGKANGNPYANSFYGNGQGTTGKGKSWGLSGRNLLEGEKVLQNCNEEGRVVVQIEVNKAGQVVRSKPGVRGTTNAAPCLLQAAKATAQTYRWNYDEDAPQIQVGFIVINFKLGE